MRGLRLTRVAMPVFGAMVLAAGGVTASSQAPEVPLPASYCSAQGLASAASVQTISELTRGFKRPAAP